MLILMQLIRSSDCVKKGQFRHLWGISLDLHAPFTEFESQYRDHNLFKSHENGVSYLDVDQVRVKHVCKDVVAGRGDTTYRCRYLNITIQDRGGKWQKELVLRQTFSIRLKKQYCYFYVPLDRTWIKVGPQLMDNSTKWEWIEYRNDTKIRTAAIHLCRSRRTKEWTIGGTYTDRNFARYDILKRDQKYVVGHVIHMRIYPKSDPPAAGEPSPRGKPYGKTEIYKDERKRSIATKDQNVVPFLIKEDEDSKYFEKDDDRDKWLREAEKIDPKDTPLISRNLKFFRWEGEYSFWGEEGIPVRSKYPTIELMVAVDQLMLRNFSNDQDAFFLFMAKTVNIAESFFYLLDVRMRIVGFKVLPEYPFTPDEGPIYVTSSYYYTHFSRLDAYLLYLKKWFYRKYIDLSYIKRINKGWGYFEGMPDAIATFTSIYYNDREAGHTTDVFDNSTEAYKKHGNVFYVKPNMDHPDLMTNELSPYSTGASLVHQIGHVLGWPHQLGKNQMLTKSTGIFCICFREVGTCLMGSCDSASYLIPDFMNGCDSTFPVVNTTTQPKLFMWNTSPRADMSEDNGEYADQFHRRLQGMRVACFAAAIADIFILIAFLFHMDILSSQMRR